ncbi:MAG: hypothetical protein EBT86_00745 [Actinobacteria bacterium]|nr:hypothetical protein [Actinomycetota bacterium]
MSSATDIPPISVTERQNDANLDVETPIAPVPLSEYIASLESDPNLVIAVSYNIKIPFYLEISKPSIEYR